MREVGGVLLVAVALTSAIHITQEIASSHPDAETRETETTENVWAVKLNPSGATWRSKVFGPRHTADTLASELNLINRGRLEPFQDVFTFELSSSLHGKGERYRRELVRCDEKLKEHSAVLWSSRQRPLRRTKRDVDFNDPFFEKQWHLVNSREVGHDINVTGVWGQNVTGRGVVIAVVDDGVEHVNSDLHHNYNSKGSYDLNSKDHDPSPRLNNPHIDNTHGTKCAGLISAVANNSVCAVGVAHGAQVSGIRMLDGTVTDILEGQSFIYKAHVNSIYSCSWGPEDNGRTVEGPGHVAKEALQLGTTNGRYGYGNIYVFASGNGGMANDNCNFDGYANSIFTLTIGAVDEINSMPYYAEPCPSMLAVTYSNGKSSPKDRSIVTTDASTHGGCTDSFTGTSAAAPIASGMVALMLEVRPCLTWRDVHAIFVYSALKMDIKGAKWIRNGAGFHHSDQHGFGLMDAFRLTVTAAVWPLLPTMVKWSSHIVGHEMGIPTNGEKLTQNLTVLDDELPEGLETLEYIAVKLTVNHKCRGALEISLQSPSGTLSTLITTRKFDDSDEGLENWTLTSARFWGETPNGTWTLSVQDNAKLCPSLSSREGMLEKWQLTFYGSELSQDDIIYRQQLVEDAVSNGSLESPLPCPPLPSSPKDIRLPDNSSTFSWYKIVIIVMILLTLIVSIHLTLECVVKRLLALRRRRKLMRSVGPVLYVRGEGESGGEGDDESESEETALLKEEEEEECEVGRESSEAVYSESLHEVICDDKVADTANVAEEKVEA